MLDALSDALGKEEAILLAYVFGSAARGDAGDASDVDVAVFATSALGLTQIAILSETLGRAISFRRRVDVVDLRAASPLLAAEVVRDGIRLIERDTEVRFDVEMAAIHRYEDTKPLRRAQQELLREVARGRP